MEFEWDQWKAASNLRKHNISFSFAALAFDDLNGIHELNDGGWPEEERSSLLGLADGTVLKVIYVEKEIKIRLISARKATRHEREIYFRKNAS